MVKSYQELDVYQRAYRLALELHKSSLQFPKIEQYALADQIRRASKSICANLAEGFAKSHKSPAEFKRFVLIAIGSAEEIIVWISFTKDLGYIDEQTSIALTNEYKTICKQLNGLMANWKS